MGNQARTIDEFEKNANEVFRVSLSTYKDRRYLDLRVFFKTDAGAWIPTKKGLTIPVSMIDRLLASIGRVKAVVD